MLTPPATAAWNGTLIRKFPIYRSPPIQLGSSGHITFSKLPRAEGASLVVGRALEQSRCLLRHAPPRKMCCARDLTYRDRQFREPESYNRSGKKLLPPPDDPAQA